jgi:putative tryptophan/tyrosine transport system substrate-binding protein
MPIVAFLSVGSPDVTAGRISAFRKGLGETGYTEDRNVQVEYHWFEGQYQHLTVVLDDLIQRHVAVMAIPGSTPISLAAKSATNTIPIVFGVGEDPVRLGLVTSLAQPGGNATGINFFGIETEAKRLGLMHDLLPKAASFAVLLNPSNPRYSEATSKSLSEAASTLGLPAPQVRSTQPSPLWRATGLMPSLLEARRCSLAEACRLPRWRYATDYLQVFLHANWFRPDC